MRTKTLILFVLLICSTLYSQYIPYNQEFRVNTYTDNSQSLPVITALADGGFVICWSSDGQDGSGRGIYAQQYRADGSVAGVEFRVNTFTNNDQGSHIVVSLKHGGYVICWQSEEQDGSGPGLYAKVYKADGSIAVDEFRVNTYTIGRQRHPAMTSLVDGGFVICWESESQNSGVDGYDIFAQRYDADGHAVGNEFQVNTFIDNSQWFPAITSLPDSGFVICWTSLYQDGSGTGVYAQRYNANNQAVGGEFQVNTYTEDEQSYPVIKNLSSGDFVISWISLEQDGSGWGVYAQCYHADGSAAGGEFRVNTTTHGFQENMVIEPLMDGGFVICWQSDRWNWAGIELYAQQYQADGHKVGQEFRVNTRQNGNQSRPVITSLANGGYMICWESRYEVETEYDIYLQRYNADGKQDGQEFRVNSYRNYFRGDSDVALLANGNFVVCWQSDGQDGYGYGIYANYLPGAPIVHELVSFDLGYPLTDTTLLTKCPDFSWGMATNTRICYPWEVVYSLYLSTDEEFINPIIYPGLQDTLYTIPIADSLQSGSTFFWKVLAKNVANDSLWSSHTNAFFISYDAFPAQVDDKVQLPTGYILEQNYPNPFNPVTTVRYTLPQAGDVELALYDVTGRRVKTLVQGVQSVGMHSVQIDGSDLASGVYLYTLKSGSFVQSKKMVLIK